MYDNWHEDWRLADAKAVVKQEQGCGECLDPEACRADGYCIKHLELGEDDELAG